MIVSLLSDWKIWIPLLSQVTLQRRVLNLIISHMSRTGTPLIKVNEGMTFWTDEPSQNLMGGEYFHFKKGVKKQKKGVHIAYKWRPDVVKNKKQKSYQ